MIDQQIRRVLGSLPEPSKVSDKAVRAALVQARDMEAVHKAAVNAEHTAQQALVGAREADREAFAAAIAAGEADPGAQAERQAKDGLEAATRRREAAEVAVTTAFDGLGAVVRKQRSAWCEALAADEGDARAELLAVLREAVNAYGVVVSRRSLRAWATSWPDAKPGAGGNIAALGLRAPNQTDYSVEQALTAVLATFEPETA